MTTTSRGAWPYTYKLGLDFRSEPNGRGAYGIYAFKNELIYNGFSRGIDPTLPLWGSSVVKRTKAFQAAMGLTVDGDLGPITARALFRHRVTAAEVTYNLPPHLLAQVKSLESDNDPVAQGWLDLDDEGLFQENLPSNPDITQVQCWTPSFIVPHAASQLASRIKNCGSAKAGTAAWNIGNQLAINWREAGYPVSGLIYTDANGNKIDYAARATNYVKDVEEQAL